jgi:polysaccharide export outer membrane protein
MGRMRVCRFPLAVLVAALVAAAAGAAAPAASAGESPGSGYRLGPKDVISIKVFELPDVNGERRVTDAGTVDLPLVGEVAAAGMTPAEFAGRLKQVLEQKILQRASVTVELVEVRSKPILVMGAVKTPGNLPFTGRWTLIEALAAAGGLGDGHADVVYILRRASNGLSDQVAVRLDDLLVKGDPRANLPIYANDLINVPGRVAIRIFCLGEVGKPGEVEFSSSDHMTVLSAIARAGGLTERASNKISIKRRRGQTLEQEIVVDYKRILAGKEPDLELKEGDVLVVKESFF